MKLHYFEDIDLVSQHHTVSNRPGRCRDHIPLCWLVGILADLPLDRRMDHHRQFFGCRQEGGEKGYWQARIHFKVFGPIIWGRGFCGWACWTAAILEWLPIKKNRPVPKKLTWLRFPVLFLSLLIPLLFINFGYDYQQHHVSESSVKLHPVSRSSALFTAPFHAAERFLSDLTNRRLYLVVITATETG